MGKAIVAAVFLSLSLTLSSAERLSAGGYAIPPQTSRSVALSNAVTAGVQDPSAVYINPAALTEIPGNQTLMGFNYINTVSGIKNSGRESINRHDDSLIPTFFTNYHVPQSDLTLGLGMYTPFGLATSYDKNSFTRYGAVRSELRTTYLTSSLAWRVHPAFSLGAGLSFVHSAAQFSRAIFASPFPDARLRLTDTDNGYAYNVGLLLKPHERLKLGLTYRGRLDLNYDTGTVKVVDGGGTTSTARSKGTQLPLVPVISAGIQYRIAPAWDIEFVYDHARWSEFRHLKARFNPVLLSGTLSGLFIQELWQDTHTLRLGSAYRLNEKIELRAGVVLEETPIPQRTLGPSIPGADLLGLSAGVGYEWKALKLDVGYMAVFYQTRNVQNNVLEVDNLANTVAPGRDKYETFQNFVSVNLLYRF
jgi:long-chain fatty acid transport protein